MRDVAQEKLFFQKVRLAITKYTEQVAGISPGHYQWLEGQSSPRLICLPMRLNPVYATQLCRLEAEYSMAVGELTADQTIRIARGDNGCLVFEIPKPQSLWYDIPESQLPTLDGFLVALGIDTNRRPVILDLAAHLAAHLLIAGTTGSGKTTALRLIIYKLALQNTPEAMRLLLFGDEHRVWDGFTRLAHLLHPVMDEYDAVPALQWAKAEIGKRKAEGYNAPAIFIAVDEAAMLLDDEEAVTLVEYIAAQGRKYGFHLVLAIQNPTAAQLGSVNIKRNMPTRLAFRVDSAGTAALVMGRGNTGAELLTGAGDGLLLPASGLVRLTTALVRPEQVKSLPQVKEVPELDLTITEPGKAVSLSASSGRTPEEVEPSHVAYCLANPGIKDRKAWEALHIGYPRIHRAQAFAKALAQDLAGYGMSIVKEENGGSD